MPTTNTHVAVHLALASGGTSKRDGRPCIENTFTIAIAANQITRLAKRHGKLWADFSSALLTLSQAEVEAQSDKLVDAIVALAKPFNVDVAATCDPRGPTITLVTSRRFKFRGQRHLNSDLCTSI